MSGLVALAAPADDRWVDQLRRVWDRGDAVFPLDQRLPRAAADRLLAIVRPTRLWDGSEEHARPDGCRVDDGDAVVLATGGTTGEPKGVILTRDAIESAARTTNAHLAIDPGLDQWLCCIPVAHAGGFGVIARALHNGTPLIVHQRFEPRAAEAVAARARTRASLVTAALHQLDPAPFATIVLGGDAPPRWPSGRPANVTVTYGMTETGGGFVYDGLVLPEMEADVRDGEIVVRGRRLGRAYRTATADVPLAGEGGWYATGDAGRVVDRRLEAFGRLADVIVTGGEKVWPGAIEALIKDLPAVRDVAIVGRPDPDWGQIVTAVVVPADPRTPPALDDLTGALEGEPTWSRPRALEIVDDLPRTDLGKLRRRAAGAPLHP